MAQEYTSWIGRGGVIHELDDDHEYTSSAGVVHDPASAAPPTGRIMSSLAGAGGLAGKGGIAGPGGGLAA